MDFTEIAERLQEYVGGQIEVVSEPTYRTRGEIKKVELNEKGWLVIIKKWNAHAIDPATGLESASGSGWKLMDFGTRNVQQPVTPIDLVEEDDGVLAIVYPQAPDLESRERIYPKRHKSNIKKPAE